MAQDVGLGDQIRVWRVPTPWVVGQGPNSAKRWWQLRSFLSGRSALYWTMAAPLRRVVESIDWRSFDVVQVEYSPLGLLPVPRDVPVVVDAHNVEYRVLERIAKHASWWRRHWLRREIGRVRRDEAEAWRRARHCLAVSSTDAAVIGAASHRPVTVVPNGIDLEELPVLPPEEAEPDRLVFIGTFRYWPNVDGVRWFVREVWPLVRAQRPGARISLIGFDPPPDIRALATVPGVEVVGAVPDIVPWLRRAMAVIVPLRAGGGTRFKLLEAFAVGRPVVSTTIGAEGIDAVPGEHFLAADDPPAFARAVVRLLERPELRIALTHAARRLVEREYGWAQLAERVLAVYRELQRGRDANGA